MLEDEERKGEDLDSLYPWYEESVFRTMCNLDWVSRLENYDEMEYPELVAVTDMVLWE